MLGREVPFVRSDLLDGDYRGTYWPDHVPFRGTNAVEHHLSRQREWDLERRLITPRTGWEPVQQPKDPMSEIDNWPAEFRDDVMGRMFDLYKTTPDESVIDSELRAMIERYRRLIPPPPPRPMYDPDAIPR